MFAALLFPDCLVSSNLGFRSLPRKQICYWRYWFNIIWVCPYSGIDLLNMLNRVQAMKYPSSYLLVGLSLNWRSCFLPCCNDSSSSCRLLISSCIAFGSGLVTISLLHPLLPRVTLHSHPIYSQNMYCYELQRLTWELFKIQGISCAESSQRLFNFPGEFSQSPIYHFGYSHLFSRLLSYELILLTDIASSLDKGRSHQLILVFNTLYLYTLNPFKVEIILQEI